MGAFCGTYAFTEIGSELVEVAPIDAHPGFSDPERWTLTGALRQAAGSNGNFTITETDSTLAIIADPELNAVDDEWQYTATDIVLSEPPDVLPTGSWKWLDVYGAELPPPPTPDGWQVLDAVDVRFAVPGDWSTPASESCDEVSPGLVVFRLDEGDPCDPPDPSPVASLNIEPRPYSAPGELIRTGERVGIGGLTADRWIEQWIDPNCARPRRFERRNSGR